MGGSGISWNTRNHLRHTPDNQPRQRPITQFFYGPDALPDAQPTVSKQTNKNFPAEVSNATYTKSKW